MADRFRRICPRSRTTPCYPARITRKHAECGSPTGVTERSAQRWLITACPARRHTLPGREVRGSHVQQLSGQDASFIYSERPHAPTHITSISIYDPSTAPGGSVTFKGILAHLDARLHLARAFRQKVVRVPADLDHPYWVEDDDFDLEYHVRHIALPKPGDWRQFCIQAARLHARPLDLSKPLWELYVIEGLDKVAGVPKGGFAFLLKIHHAAVDGKSGIEMITAIHSQTPEVLDPPPPDTPWRPEPDPSPFDLYRRAALNGLRTPARAMRLTGRIVPGLGRAAATMRNQSDAPAGGMAPGTRFNGPVTAHRVLDAKF